MPIVDAPTISELEETTSRIRSWRGDVIEARKAVGLCPIEVTWYRSANVAWRMLDRLLRERFEGRIRYERKRGVLRHCLQQNTGADECAHKVFHAMRLPWHRALEQA